MRLFSQIITTWPWDKTTSMLFIRFAYIETIIPAYRFPIDHAGAFQNLLLIEIVCLKFFIIKTKTNNTNFIKQKLRYD